MTLSLRSTSTSSAERGAMLPVSASRRQVWRRRWRWDRRFRSRWIVLPVRRSRVHRSTAIPPDSRPNRSRTRVRRYCRASYVAERSERSIDRVAATSSHIRTTVRIPRLVVRQVHPLVRGVGVLVRRVEAQQDDRQAEDLLEAGADRDRAALADVDGRPPERRLEGARGGLRRGMVDRGQARVAAAEVRDARRGRPAARSPRRRPGTPRRSGPDPGR